MSFQSQAKAYVLTFRRAPATECTEAKNVQNLHGSRMNPANRPISTLTSVPSPSKTEVGYHIGTDLLQDSCCAEAKGRKVKYRGQALGGAETCKQIHADVQPYQGLGGTLCCAGSLTTCI